MQWWAWIAVGAILLGAELTFVNAQFYLVFVGAAALTVGALRVTEVVQAPWLQWALFALLSAVAMVGFRRRIYERLRRNLPVMHSGPVGELVTLPQSLAPGETCRIEHRGSSWNASNPGPAAITAGCRARIARVDGLTLIVHAEGAAGAST